MFSERFLYTSAGFINVQRWLPENWCRLDVRLDVVCTGHPETRCCHVNSAAPQFCLMNLAGGVPLTRSNLWTMSLAFLRLYSTVLHGLRALTPIAQLRIFKRKQTAKKILLFDWHYICFQTQIMAWMNMPCWCMIWGLDWLDWLAKVKTMNPCCCLAGAIVTIVHAAQGSRQVGGVLVENGKIGVKTFCPHHKWCSNLDANSIWVFLILFA